MPCTADRDYFWEIEMLNHIYGTSVMVGVGTLKANLKKFELQYDNLLGSDEESWGYSFNGKLHHNGVMTRYKSRFEQGNIVGVHLDMWYGTLSFFVNGKPIGVAFTSLKNHTLYPMVCSTAARCTMRIVCSYSYTSSLQLMCLKAIGSKPELVKKVKVIPSLKLYAENLLHLYPVIFRRGKKRNRAYRKREDIDTYRLSDPSSSTSKFHLTFPVEIPNIANLERTGGSKEIIKTRTSHNREDINVQAETSIKFSDHVREWKEVKRMCL